MALNINYYTVPFSILSRSL